MVDTLAPDVRLFNPSSADPVQGRERARMIFTVLNDVFEDFEHTQVLSGGPADHPDAGTTQAVVFRARVGDIEVQGVDIFEIDGDDRIATFTVMLRPLAGLAALTDAIRARFAPGTHPTRPG